MLTGDVGATAVLARDDAPRRGHACALFHPLKFMLASPAEDAAEIMTRLGPTVWVEDKYDGIRSQLHRAGDEVRLYSRDLHDISGQFPEVVDGARDLPWDGILDGELLAYRDGAVLPFVALQTRLGRKAPSAAILEPGAGHLRRVRRARARATRRRRSSSRCSSGRWPSAAAGSRPRACRWPRTAAGSPAPTSCRWRRSTSSRPPSPTPAPGATRA